MKKVEIDAKHASKPQLRCDLHVRSAQNAAIYRAHLQQYTAEELQLNHKEGGVRSQALGCSHGERHQFHCVPEN